MFRFWLVVSFQDSGTRTLLAGRKSNSADATASSEPEFHTASLKNLAYAFAYVTTTDEVVRQIEH